MYRTWRPRLTRGKVPLRPHSRTGASRAVMPSLGAATGIKHRGRRARQGVYRGHSPLVAGARTRGGACKQADESSWHPGRRREPRRLPPHSQRQARRSATSSRPRRNRRPSRNVAMSSPSRSSSHRALIAVRCVTRPSPSSAPRVLPVSPEPQIACRHRAPTGTGRGEDLEPGRPRPHDALRSRRPDSQ